MIPDQNLGLVRPDDEDVTVPAEALLYAMPEFHEPFSEADMD